MFWNKSYWVTDKKNSDNDIFLQVAPITDYKGAQFICALLSLCVCLMLLSGCVPTVNSHTSYDPGKYQLPQDPNLPKITDPRYRAQMPTSPSRSRGKKSALLRVSRLDFPLKMKLTRALQNALPAGDRQAQYLLKDNGLRIDLLPISEFEDFAKALGEPLNIWRSNINMAPDGTPLSTTPQIKKQVSIDIHDPQQPQTFVTKEGWFRLMLTVQKVKLGSIELNIIPQHYLPKTSVKPRSPFDKIWDGTLFDMLKTTVTLPNSHLLVITRTQRPTLAEYRQKYKPKLFDVEPGSNAMIKENHNIGDVLLTYNYWNHPVQMVYVIARQSKH